MVGLEDGILPHSRSIESDDPEDLAEERRLAYVGITRAKQRLYLVHAFRRSLWGNTEVQTPSRFLNEIPTDLLTGMVDKRSRREASFQRATTWGDDEERSSRPMRPTQPRSPYTGTRLGESKAGQAKQTYWSPGSDAQSTRPSPSEASRTPGADAVAGRTAHFKRRDSVQHAKFGVGTVIESALTRDDEEVTVAFPGVGIKKLLASLAGLKKV
jgi:DNA helicase-2/ATP-dependent DNA helicase PcrA